jgi:hypothetical protein
MTKPTQATRVLAALARAGDHGITQGEWLVPGGADGVGRITRVAARIEELRSEGIAILVDGKREGFAVYRLVLEASSQPARDRVEGEGFHLFDLPAQKTSSSHWEIA